MAIEFRKLKDGEVVVATSDMISLETQALVNGACEKLEFRGYRCVVSNDAHAEWLIKEFNSGKCPWLKNIEYMGAEKLDPLYDIRKKAVEEYIASQAAAQAANIPAAAGAAGSVDTGVTTTADAAIATAQANAAAKAKQLEVPKSIK